MSEGQMPITRSGFGRSPKPKIIPIGETEDAAAGGSDQQCPDQRIKAQRIEMMPIERLIPNPRNAKKHPPKQIAFLCESIKRFGLNQPLVIDRNYKIHCGHARYEAARKIGLSQVPVIKRKDLTDAELKALAIADNKLSELGEWDMEILAEQFQALCEVVSPAVV